MLVDAIAEDLHELFEDRSLAAVALLCEFGRIVVVAKHTAFVLVVAVLSAEDGRAHAASKVLNVVLMVECRDVRTSQRATTSVA